MIININTNRQQLRTWRQARTWCHVWWLSVTGGLDIGTLDVSEIKRLARRFRIKLLQTLDKSGIQAYVSRTDGERRFRYPFRAEAYDEHHKAIESVLEMVNCALLSPEKVGSWSEFSYGVSNALIDGAPYAPPCQKYPGIPNGTPREGEMSDGETDKTTSTDLREEFLAVRDSWLPFSSKELQ